MRNCYLTILSVKYNVTKATLHPLKQRPFFTLFSCNSKITVLQSAYKNMLVIWTMEQLDSTGFFLFVLFFCFLPHLGT